MTITSGYTDLSTIKGSDLLNISATDTNSDALLEQIIESASRTIDSDAGQYFYISATDETKYFESEYSDKLFLSEPLVSITTLATDIADSRTYADVWTTADYDLTPFNAAAKSRPYTAIVRRANSAFYFPPYHKGIKIVGIFGWPTVPAKIKQACVLLTMRLFKRLSTPLGVASMAALGEVQISIKDKDPDYWHLLSEFMPKV